MAIVWVQETTQDRSARFLGDGGRAYTRTARVKTDTLNTSPAAILLDASVPQRGDSHPDDAHAICVDTSTKQLESERYFWDVTVEYRTGGQASTTASATPTTSLATPAEDPTEDPPTVEIDTFEFTRPLSVDYSTTPLYMENTAGEPFDPPIEEEVGLDQYTVSMPLSAYNVFVWNTLRKTINQQQVRIKGNGSEVFNAQTLWLKSHRASRSIRNGIFYVRVTAILIHNPDGFDITIPSMGYRNAGGLTILDPAGNPFQRPSYLGEAGFPADEPWPIVRKPKRVASWSTLPIVSVV